MSLTTTQEHALIVDAQAGDASAKLKLLAEYRGNIQSVIHDSLGASDQDRRDELEAELTTEFLQCLADIDPEADTRVWAVFGRTGIFQALENFRRTEYALSGDGMDRMLQRVAQVERRMAETGETIEDACQHAQISVTTFLAMQDARNGMPSEEVDEGRKDRYGRTVAPYLPNDRDDRVARAEAALLSMTPLQRYLVVDKYGFQPDGFDQLSDLDQAEDIVERKSLPWRGRTNASVAERYNNDLADSKPLTKSGSPLIARKTVDRELGVTFVDGIDLDPESAYNRARAAR